MTAAAPEGDGHASDGAAEHIRPLIDKLDPEATGAEMHAPFRGKVRLAELEKHLHSLPSQPSLIPYRTSYYEDDWGFCLTHEQRTRLRTGEYDVLIDTSLTEGSLTYGELVVPGASADEVLV